MNRLIPLRGVVARLRHFCPQAHELPIPDIRAECHRRAACIMSEATNGQLMSLATSEGRWIHSTLKTIYAPPDDGAQPLSLLLSGLLAAWQTAFPGAAPPRQVNSPSVDASTMVDLRGGTSLPKTNSNGTGVVANSHVALVPGGARFTGLILIDRLDKSRIMQAHFLPHLPDRASISDSPVRTVPFL